MYQHTNKKLQPLYKFRSIRACAHSPDFHIATAPTFPHMVTLLSPQLHLPVLSSPSPTQVIKGNVCSGYSCWNLECILLWETVVRNDVNTSATLQVKWAFVNGLLTISLEKLF